LHHVVTACPELAAGVSRAEAALSRRVGRVSRWPTAATRSLVRREMRLTLCGACHGRSAVQHGPARGLPLA